MSKAISFLGGDLAYRHDSSAVVRIDVEEGAYSVAAVREWRPSKGNPLVPSVVRAEMIEVAKVAHCNEIALDLHGIDDAKEQFSKASIAIFELPNGQSGKVAMYQVAKELLHAKRVRIPWLERRLISQIKAIIGKPTSGGGLSIAAARNASGHGDVCSAFVAALYLAHERNGSPVTRLSTDQLHRIGHSSRWGRVSRDRGF